MDHSNIRTFKRPLDIPTREQLATIFNPHKRLKTPQVPDNASIPRGTHFVNDENLPTTSNLSTTKQNTLDANDSHHQFNHHPLDTINDAPLLNSVPPNIVPIVHPPAITSDFFTDVTTDLSNENTAQQVYGIIKKFPPPIPPPPPHPPFMSELDGDVSDDERGGIMVPFIYPPPPVINVDKLPLSLTEFRRKFQQSLKLLEKRDNKMKDRESSEERMSRGELNGVGGLINSHSESKASSAAPLASTPAPAATPSGPAKRGRKPKVRPEQQAQAQKEEEEEARARKASLEVGTSDNLAPEGTGQVDTQSDNVSSAAEKDHYVYVQAPPLSFPPPNYMAYPLSAEKSTLVPEEVFTSLLEANEQLPRVDMVLASAAGSLFDIRKEAMNKGMTRDDFELQKLRKETVEISLDVSSEGEPSATNSPYNDEEYYSKIDDEVYQDVYQAQWPKVNIFNKTYIDPDYARVRPQLSNIEEKPYVESKKELENVDSYPHEAMTGLERIDRLNVFPFSSREFILSTGAMKEKRRKKLRSHLENMEEFELRNSDDIYRAKKYKLLQRIDNLRASKIHFQNSIIRDEELKQIQQRLEIERDYELVKLKLFEKYELLKNSLLFYEESNKVYKHLNMVLINKLEKLKNFFEYQQELFTHLLEQQNKNGGGDVFDISNKNSSKLFQGISLKNADRPASSSSSDEANDEAPGNLNHASESDKLLNEMMNPSSKFALVHDFMPLITQEEFSIITSDVPKKLKPTTSTKTSMKHQIFANPIYDRLMTSGSDTNASDSNASGFKSGSPQPQLVLSGPKRRGRRAAATAMASTTISTSAQTNVASSSGNGTTVGVFARNGGVPSTPTKTSGFTTAFQAPTMQNTYMRDSVAFNHRYTEAGLLAKITKQFYGPQMANSDELNHDLKLMGIDTKWPVGK